MGRFNWLFIAAVVFSLSLPEAVFAGRCATSVRNDPEVKRFAHPAPLARGALLPRVAAPIEVRNSKVHVTEHFQIFWGSSYTTADMDWADIDRDGVPAWVERLAAALEDSLAAYAASGFPAPYGVDNYYLDVYVGNTGVQIFDSASSTWQNVTISSSYYAWTDIDTDYNVAFFVFGNNFNTAEDLPILDAVAAHELFHAVQRGAGYPWNDPTLVPDSKYYDEMWWFEATATWMEDERYPDVNDYTVFVSHVFLNYPNKALNTFDGQHEYGAAIFAGYVKGLCGSTLPFTEIASQAYLNGMWTALGNKVEECSSDTFQNEVAKFWSLAAHPADYWPDGADYASGGLTSKIKSVTYTPYASAPSTTLQPQEYGAELFSVANSLLPTHYSLSGLAATASPKVAVSAKGSSIATVVAASDIIAKPESVENVYLATVNASPTLSAMSYTINIGNSSPVLLPIGDVAVGINESLSFTILATDSNGDVLTYGAVGLPSGATLDPSTGAFSWTPTSSQSGVHSVTFTVTDQIAEDSETIFITVDGGVSNSPPVLSPIGDKAATANMPLSFSLVASDADSGTLTYGATGLPDGATLNSSTGAFLWTPTSAQLGTHAVTFSVSDGALVDSETVTITVNPQNVAPVLASIGNKTAYPGTELKFQLFATDGNGDALTFGAANLPTGSSWDSSAGSFTWVPSASQAGDFSVTFTVSDGKLSDSETITITVKATTSSGGASGGCFIEALGGPKTLFP